jgi:TonB family protein
MIKPRCFLFLAALMNVVPFVSAATSAAVGGSFWDDRPLKVIQTTTSNFPVRPAAEGILEGQVRAVITVDAEGNFTDCLILSYTHSDFATEVLESLRVWDYEPARHRGQPVGTRADMTFLFQGKGMVFSGTASEVATAQVNRLFGSPPVSVVCHATELDQPLTTTKVVNPRHPGKALSPEHLAGTAVLDFYVDPEGRPRMPVAIRASHEQFAVAAIDALSEWRFTPPTRKGRPMAVRIRQEFVFRNES